MSSTPTSTPTSTMTSTASGSITGTSIPWRDWFTLAVSGMGMAPAAFWALSVQEWRWLMVNHPRGGVPLSRAGFDHLLKQYPDKEQ